MYGSKIASLDRSQGAITLSNKFSCLQTSAAETWLRVLFVIYLVANFCMMLVNFGAIFMEYFHKRVQEKLQGGVREGTTSVRVRVHLL